MSRTAVLSVSPITSALIKETERLRAEVNAERALADLLVDVLRHARDGSLPSAIRRRAAFAAYDAARNP